MANLIIWRHAEAEVQSETGHDSDRALTKRGYKDAAKIAKWLHKHMPDHVELLCSPARRCFQTAQALRDINHVEIKVSDFLSVDSNVAGIVKEISNKNESQTILIVGHQPNLGLLISKLLALDESACLVKKGAVWWLKQRKVGHSSHYYIHTVMQPNF
ncbi:MAG: histidine phosphatase family protein [Methylotenera sp.]|nr:histidine phosphatase family protein [Methylotenera sp.]